jgi:hypothetical protein
METPGIRNQSRPILSQPEKNSTSWIGHMHNDPKDHVAGQTFICPSDGILNNIQVYSTSVHQPGILGMSLHEFDPGSRTWGPAIGNSSLSLQRNDSPCWVRFDLQPISIKKNACYGFRLYSADALVGVGEAATNQQPFSFGHEWHADSTEHTGYYFSYFSLAFKVELCA